MMIVRPENIKVTNLCVGCCYVIELYESGDLRVAERSPPSAAAITQACVDVTSIPEHPKACLVTVEDVSGDKYNLVQACCAKGNHLHKITRINKMCNFIDITIDDDFASPHGRKIAIDGLRGPADTIFFTGPCTGGSKWTRLNAARGGKTFDKIQRRRMVFWTLWDSFLIVAKHAISVDARILIELPRGCTYWHDPRMSDFLGKHGFSYADFDGCMYGLVARHGPDKGRPICKPWMIACLDSFLFTFLFGGLTGVILSAPPLDFAVSDSYFVVAHFRYTGFGTVVCMMLSGIYIWWLKITGQSVD